MQSQNALRQIMFVWVTCKFIWGSLDATLEDSDKKDAKTFSFVKKLAANVESRKKGLGQCLCMFLLLYF